MRRCTQCGAVSPDTARTCQRCGSAFQGKAGSLQRSGSLKSTHTSAPDAAQSRKKQRSFLVGLLGLLGIRYNPEKGTWGCAFVPAAISVTLAAVVVAGVVLGPVLKRIPPFAPGLTVIGTVAPGASVTVHGMNFPPGSTINLTLDGTSVALAPAAQRSLSQGWYAFSLAAVQMSSLQQTKPFSSLAGSITVRSDGTFDAQVTIPQTWQAGSQHVIQAQAVGQDGSAQAQVQQTVTMPGTGQSNTSSPPSSSGGSSVTVSFSGSLSGSLVVSKVNSCGASSGNYAVNVSGSINGTSYEVRIGVDNYAGPGQYDTNPAGAAGGAGDVGVSNPNDNGDRWGSIGQPGSVTVNSDGKSGSVSTSVLNPVSGGSAQITGSWTC